MNGTFSLNKPITENEILRRQVNRTVLPEDPETKDRSYVSWFLGSSVNTKDYNCLRRSRSAILSKNDI